MNRKIQFPRHVELCTKFKKFFSHYYVYNKMSSAQSVRAQNPVNKMFINIGDIRSTIVDATNTPVTWTGASAGIIAALQTPGSAVLRDMGKTIYLPDPTVASLANGQSTILRKIQYVPSGANGVYGTGAAASGQAAPGASGEYYTGYIRLGGQTFGGGDGVPTAVARIN